MPFISIKKQKELNNIFRNKLKEIEEEVYPLSDPSILKGKVNAQLEILNTTLENLKKEISGAIKKCDDLKREGYSNVRDIINDVKELIRAHFDDFREKICEIEGSILEVGGNFVDKYGDKINQWKTDFIDKIDKINETDEIDNKLSDEKIKFDDKEFSLGEIVESYSCHLLTGKKGEHYLDIDKIIKFITELKGQ